MKKTIISSLIIILVLISLVGCGNKEDALKFKEEYEALNDKENSSGQKHRSLTISEKNPFVYATPKDIIEKIENKETFYVYFGSSYCPWCRSVIEKTIEVAKDNKVKTIYYVDIWDGDHVEILRDTYKLNDEGEVELVFEGAPEYKDLLKYLDNVLSDYNLTDAEGNKVSVGEKRIMAPNFIYVKDGKAEKIVTGISSSQSGSRDELTEEILKDEENTFKEFFNNK